MNTMTINPPKPQQGLGRATRGLSVNKGLADGPIGRQPDADGEGM